MRSHLLEGTVRHRRGPFDMEPWVAGEDRHVFVERDAHVDPVHPFLHQVVRHDRLNVTQRECDSVATTLRLLAEQVSDQASSLGDNEDHLAIAEALGSLAQALR